MVGRARQRNICRCRLSEGTPWLRMFDVLGNRVDEILYAPAYWTMLRNGYQAGAVWRVFESGSLIPGYLLGYITAFYDTGLYCPYTARFQAAIPLSKYAEEPVKQRFLPQMLHKDGSAWQGATWIFTTNPGDNQTWAQTCRPSPGRLEITGFSTARNFFPAMLALSWRLWPPEGREKSQGARAVTSCSPDFERTAA